jgi:uncharacterized protein
MSDLTRLTTNDVLELLGAPSVRQRADVVVARGRGPDPDALTAVRIAVSFAVILRKLGIAVPVGSVTTFAEALCAVGMQKRSSVYWAGRAVLLRRPEDRDLYDRAFNAFWFAVVASSDAETMVQKVTVELDDDDDPDAEGDEESDDDGAEGETISVRFSAAETLRHKDFADYTPEEFLEARAAMSSLRFVGSPRRSRRRQPVTGTKRTSSPDVRRTVRNALKTDGVAIRRSFTEPSTKPRRIVLLCDVSGSMESYARALVRFCQAAVVGRGRVEAFALGTRLTRITRELSSRDPDEALRKAARRVVDWSGGTRLGEGMRAFNDEWGVRGMARGAIVVVLSDGWDRGSPELLGRQMERLHRVAHRVVWVNPLKAAPGYAPLARGMAAALPHIDTFIEGHSLASLESLAKVLAED